MAVWSFFNSFFVVSLLDAVAPVKRTFAWATLLACNLVNPIFWTVHYCVRDHMHWDVLKGETFTVNMLYSPWIFLGINYIPFLCSFLWLGFGREFGRGLALTMPVTKRPSPDHACNEEA